MWDVQTKQCFLTQEGHANKVHCIAFHPDGSLVLCGTGYDDTV